MPYSPNIDPKYDLSRPENVDLCTCSSLLAPTLERHYELYSSFFRPDDVVLDIGSGPGLLATTLRSKGIECFNYEPRHLANIQDVPATVNLLHFSESLGYLSTEELNFWLQEFPGIKRIILKDFLASVTKDETPWEYDFSCLRHYVIPFLRSRKWAVEIFHFYPHRQRWQQILRDKGIPLVEYPNIIPVIVSAVHNG